MENFSNESLAGCVYRVETSSQCKPPDNSILEERHCKQCSHYLNWLDQKEADKTIDSIEQGITVFNQEKNIIYEHPKSLDAFSLKDLDTSNTKSLLEFDTMRRYCNEDYLSQCISLNSRWRSVMNSCIANLNGYTGALYWNTIPFNRPIEDLTVFQLKLLDTSLRVQSYNNQYRQKSLCRQCFEGEKKLETILKHRQKTCHKDKNHDVSKADSRIYRFYYEQDEQKNMYIAGEDFKVVSLVEWFTDDFRSVNDSKRRLKNKSKK